jgi:hypothetical protein
MKRMMIVCALLASGCEMRDPMNASDRPLTPGADMMIVRGDDLYSRTRNDPDQVVVRLAAPETDVPVADVPVGTKVRVIEDPDGKTRAQDEERSVKILILEGKLEGKVATVERSHLRPLPAQ